MFLQVKLTHQIPGDNTEKIWAHRFLAKTKQLQLEGGPERCPGGSKAPFFFFLFLSLFEILEQKYARGT